MHFQPVTPTVKFRALGGTPANTIAGLEETSPVARRQITHALAYRFAPWPGVALGARPRGRPRVAVDARADPRRAQNADPRRTGVAVASRGLRRSDVREPG